MDKSEILYSYNAARNKTQQIRILSELNDCSIDDIIILIADGLRGDSDRKPQVPPKASSENLIKRLEEELDRLDKEIREHEKRYQEIVITMKVIMDLSRKENGT